MWSPQLPTQPFLSQQGQRIERRRLHINLETFRAVSCRISIPSTSASHRPNQSNSSSKCLGGQRRGVSMLKYTWKAGRAQVAARVVDRLGDNGTCARLRGDRAEHNRRPGLGLRGLAVAADPAGFRAGVAAAEQRHDLGDCGRRGGAGRGRCCGGSGDTVGLGVLIWITCVVCPLKLMIRGGGVIRL